MTEPEIHNTAPTERGCQHTCTDGWIYGRGEWIQCPNHRLRGWPIGRMPPPVKTTRAREAIARAKATVREIRERNPEPNPLRRTR